MRALFSMRKLLFVPLALSLWGCAHDDTRGQIAGVTGTVVQAVDSPDGTAQGILTQQGQHYRIYIRGYRPGEKLEMMAQTTLDRVVSLTWRGAQTLAVHGLCRAHFFYAHGNDYLYPHPDAAHGIGIAVMMDDC
jgi:hypothetical protein